MKSFLTIIILLFFHYQGFSQNYIGDQKEIDKILKNISDFSGYVVNSNHEKIGELYAEDAKIFPKKVEIIKGREMITAYWKLPEDVKITLHEVTPTEIKIIQDEAYDYGHYKGTTKGSNGEEVSWKGKYVIVWKKVGKDWKIYLDIWNSIND